jgi:glycerol dehydrogenase-like iron-containing ADH family enzyme
LLDELEEAADDIGAVTDDGVRFLADAYRRIGAACAWAGHSRFEEGSEHFWAYAYEHSTGAHPVHGEIIAFAVCAMAHVQGNEPDRARRIVERTKVRAHPEDLGVTEPEFRGCLLALREFARSTDLDQSVVDFVDVSSSDVEAAWRFVTSLPRQA